MNEEILSPQRYNDEITVNIKELFLALWSKIYIIIAASILGGILFFGGTKLLITPVYTSVTKVYILSRQDDSTGITYNDLQLGSQLIQDYIQLVQSRPVLERVISSLDLDLTPEQLSDMITIDAPTNNRILSICANSSSPEEARAIADSLRESVGEEFSQILDISSISTVEEANLPQAPSSPNVQKNVIIGVLAGFFISTVILSILFIMDDTIKTSEDIERYLKLNVLASVPMQKSLRKSTPPKRRFKPKRYKRFKKAKLMNP